MYQKFASIALQMIASVNVQATDENLQAVVATRNMLTQIANGTLVVGIAAPAPAQSEPGTAA